jgi:galactokinase
MEFLIHLISTGNADQALQKLYGKKTETLELQKVRFADLIRSFTEKFPSKGEIELFSTPGRTEVGGNHTDHNGGRVLAAALDLDIVAAAVKNDGNIIRIQSKQFPALKVNTDDLDVVQDEHFTSAALVRGVCARLVQLGYKIGGFDAVTTSSVPIGSGLSSSAAFEVLIVSILNHLFNHGVIEDVKVAKISQFAENVYFGKPSGLMDQTTCALGGFITIDFRDFDHPNIRKVEFDFEAQGYSVVIVDTGGDHANLNQDYRSVQQEMSSVAHVMGGEVLGEFSKERFLANLPAIRSKVSDRAILRAIHFFDDDHRVLEQVAALERGNFKEFLRLVNESGDSSWRLAQNVFSCTNVHDQRLGVALALSEIILKDVGAWRVHGGGFAGSIQAFVPDDIVEDYISRMETVFGEGSCHRAIIRPIGTTLVKDLIQQQE